MSDGKKQAWEDLPDVAPSDWESLPDVEPATADASGRVGEVRAGETPEQAAARLGGHFVTPEETAQRLGGVASKVGRAIASPIIAAAQGFTRNWGDELAAIGDTLGQAERDPNSPMRTGPLPRPLGMLNPGALEYLRAKLAANQRDWQAITDTATSESPVSYLVGAVASPSPVGKLGLLGRLATGAGMGAVAGAGGSRAHLAAGDSPAELAKDTRTGAGIGLAAAGIGEALGAGARGIGNWASKQRAAMDAAKAAAIADDVNSGVASLEGKYGSAVQQASRTTENLQRASSGLPPVGSGGPSIVDPSLAMRANLALSDPTTRAVNEGVIEASLARLPQQTSAVAAAKSAWQTAAADAPNAIAKKIAEYQGQTLLDPLKTWAKSQIPRQAAGALFGGGLYAAGEATDTPWLKAAGPAAYATIAGAPGAYRAAQNFLGSPQAVSALGTAAGLTGVALQQASSAASTALTYQPGPKKQQDDDAIAAFLSGG